MRKVRVIAPIIIVVLALVAYVTLSPCEIIRPLFDSRFVEAAEAKELFPNLISAYRERRSARMQYPASLGKLPAPVRVDAIFGRWASISVNGPMPEGLLEGPFGAAWQKVYANHHNADSRSCVYLHYSWNGGGKTTVCCMSIAI